MDAGSSAVRARAARPPSAAQHDARTANDTTAPSGVAGTAAALSGTTTTTTADSAPIEPRGSGHRKQRGVLVLSRSAAAGRRGPAARARRRGFGFDEGRRLPSPRRGGAAGPRTGSVRSRRAGCGRGTSPHTQRWRANLAKPPRPMLKGCIRALQPEGISICLKDDTHPLPPPTARRRHS